MKCRAVIFDLFGTLVDNFSRHEYERVLKRMASVLGAPPDDFVRLWFDTGDLRMRGILQSPEGNIDHICRELGLQPSETSRNRAIRIRYALTRGRLVVPRVDAVDVLTRLRSAGYKNGLISDCSGETTSVWEETSLAPLMDATVFSCLAGVKKPDPRIYHLAVERLTVKPEECMYVADGVGQELGAASEVGMYPVLIRVPYEDTPDAARISEEDWGGPSVSSLTEVLSLLR